MKRRGDFFTSKAVVLLLCIVLLCGCSFSGFQQGISDAIQNNPDPQTIKEAFPTFLVLTDALIESDPKNVKTLSRGAELYSAYAALFIDDPARLQTLVTRARAYGQKAFCLDTGYACDLDSMDYGEFLEILNRVERDNLSSLYAFTISWLVWAKNNASDWSVIASLSKYQAALVRILEFDEGYKQGSALVYLAILKTLRPPSLGGRPDEGRAIFEKAITLSGGKNLTAKVEMANSYARMLYDRELHDRLLREVQQSPAEAPGLTLMNVLAKRRADALLESADDYF